VLVRGNFIESNWLCRGRNSGLPPYSLPLGFTFLHLSLSLMVISCVQPLFVKDNVGKKNAKHLPLGVWKTTIWPVGGVLRSKRIIEFRVKP